jgi:hypothetical protein
MVWGDGTSMNKNNRYLVEVDDLKRDKMSNGGSRLKVRLEAEH